MKRQHGTIVQPSIHRRPRYIKAYRQLLGITATDFAAIVGLSKSSISRHEGGIAIPFGSHVEKYVEAGLDRDRIIEEHGIWPAR